ncbi:MAG: HDOD domain-containing protein [Ignavibacteriaceae bacterium]|nr:HDOD domain-containing protein [Ignavibacteriaceae bacterium]
MIEVESRSNYYKNFLRNVQNLPSIPYMMIEVTKLLDNPKTSASELGFVISRDQGLVAKILTVANSPLYGLPRRVSTIEFAIVILGFDHIKNIVIALSMIEAFKNITEKKWNRKTFWVHSLVTAAAAKRIADDIGYPKSGEAFTAGLLHDLGISVIQRYFKDEFAAICDLVENQQMSFVSAENEILGITHQEIGSFLAEKWNLPKILSDSMLNHHEPSKNKGDNVLSAIVHLADFMTQKFGIGNFSWDENYTLDEGIIPILRLGNLDYLNKFIDSYETLFKHQIESLKI